MENTKNDLTGKVLKSKTKKQIVDEENKNKSHELVQKCLREVVYLYKISASIEMIIFLLLELIFFMFYYSDTDMFENFEINNNMRNYFQIKEKSVDHIVDIDDEERIYKIFTQSFNLTYYMVKLLFIKFQNIIFFSKRFIFENKKFYNIYLIKFFLPNYLV